MFKISSILKIITFTACIFVVLGHQPINIGTGNYTEHPPLDLGGGK